MKMLKKRMMSLAIASVMLISMAGCGKKGTAPMTKNENGEWVPQEQLELVVWNTQGTDATANAVIEEDIVTKWLEEKTLVKIDNLYGNGGGQWDAQLSKLVTGNNLPDIVYCGAGQGPAHFKKLKQLGKLWDLTPEIIKEYAPDLWERTPQEYWDAMTDNDGKILGIPFQIPVSAQANPNMTEQELEFVEYIKRFPTDVKYSEDATLLVRDDILQKIYPDAMSYEDILALVEEKQAPIGDYLLDVPIKSTEEFIQFLEKVQALNLTEDGKTVYPVGFAGADNWSSLAEFGADLCGYKTHYYTGTWNWETERIEIPLAGDLIKNSAKTINGLIHRDIISKESLVDTTTRFQEKVSNGLYAVVNEGYLGMDADTFNNQLKQQGKTFRYRPFMTQVPAQKGYKAFKEQATWGESLGILNTLTEDEMHQVLNWINVQYTDECEQVRYWGPAEAGLYIENEDGTRSFKDEKLQKYFVEGDKSAITDEKDKKGLERNMFWGMFSVAANYKSHWAWDVMYQKDELRPVTYSAFRFPKESEHVENVVVSPLSQGWSPIYADIPEVITFWAERETWENNFTIALVAEPENFDAEWDDAVKKLNEIVDIKTMEDKMTEIAKPLAEGIKASGINDGKLD